MIGTMLSKRPERSVSLICQPKAAAKTAPTRSKLSYSQIAKVGARQIETMTPASLIDLIQCGGLHFLQPRVVKDLRYHDLRVLRQLAHLACRACRNRMEISESPERADL
jgi:hypothetical protein